MSLVEGDLLRDLDPLRFRQRGGIQLVAEHAEQRDRAARSERRHPADLMIRHAGDMRAHRARWIDQRRSPLDAEPLDRVRVVAGPCLRRVGEQARIEATAAAGAGLEQDLGERRREALVHRVDAEHVAVEQLALAVGR